MCQQAPVFLGQNWSPWIFISRPWTYPLCTGEWLYGTNPHVQECHTTGRMSSESQTEMCLTLDTSTVWRASPKKPAVDLKDLNLLSSVFSVFVETTFGLHQIMWREKRALCNCRNAEPQGQRAGDFLLFTVPGHVSSTLFLLCNVTFSDHSVWQLVERQHQCLYKLF